MRRNFSWTFFGNVIYAGSQWGLLASFAKFGSPLIVGEYALGLAIVEPVFYLLDLQIRVTQATDAKHQFTFGEYFGLRLATSFIGLLIIVIIAAFNSGPTAWVIVLVGTGRGLYAVSDIIYGLWQKNERMDLVSKSMIYNGLISLLALAVIFWATRNAILSLISTAIASLAILLLYNLPHARKYEGIKPIFKIVSFRKLSMLSLPLGMAMMLITVYLYIPRYFIEIHLGTEALGFYTAVVYLSMVGTTIVSALGKSALPRLAKYYAGENIMAFRHLIIKIIWIGIVIAVLGVLMTILAGREILATLYNPEYANHADIFTWLMVAAGISYISAFLGAGITAARYFRIQFPLQLIVVIVMLVASALLIPSNGLLGAALATCIAFAVRLLLESIVLVYSLRTRSLGIM